MDRLVCLRIGDVMAEWTAWEEPTRRTALLIQEIILYILVHLLMLVNNSNARFHTASQPFAAVVYNGLST